jgi:hypothetical protein
MESGVHAGLHWAGVCCGGRTPRLPTNPPTRQAKRRAPSGAAAGILPPRMAPTPSLPAPSRWLKMPGSLARLAIADDATQYATCRPVSSGNEWQLMAIGARPTPHVWVPAGRLTLLQRRTCPPPRHQQPGRRVPPHQDLEVAQPPTDVVQYGYHIIVVQHWRRRGRCCPRSSAAPAALRRLPCGRGRC